MIIGISGKIKSGKDTAGQMIIDMTAEKCTERIENEFGDSTYKEAWNPCFRVIRFADKLKGIASLLTGVPREKFEDQEFKASNMDSEWAQPAYKKSYPMPHIPTYREFLQQLGTEVMRNLLHENVWVNAAMSDIDDKNVIFTDVRFPNEAQAIKDKGGVIIRINRYPPGCSSKLMDEHESEKALDDWKFDHVIYNVGTLEDLWNQVKEILNRYKLITKQKVNFAV